ncbi:MAG TPA: DUF6602 domain-containing protein [Phycisphaerales bacterium]|nr:DUF6602 domain-containing protein [Phycisphaerales bacterium]
MQQNKRSSPSAARVRKWLDDLDSELLIGARRAGLIEHPTLIGNAREFLVRRCLSAILPASVTVGSGRILAATGESKQIDVVIYDSRFPCLRFSDGESLFFREGVVAAIEVKSSLDASGLFKALDNTKSVLELGFGIRPKPLSIAAGPTNAELLRYLAPSAYIFAFDGINDYRQLGNGIAEWLNQIEHSEPRAMLPNLVVSGACAAYKWDDALTLQQDQNPMDDEWMASFATSHRFGWLAAHLLYAVERRIMDHPNRLGVDLTIMNHCPIMEYAREAFTDKHRQSIGIKNAARD